jgi:hypothetical protein
MEVAIKPSNRRDKRFKAEFPNKTVHFGSKGGSTFIDHKDSETKANWKKRHIVREDWNDYETAGALSKHVLWNKTTLRESIRNLNRRQSQFKFKLGVE